MGTRDRLGDRTRRPASTMPSTVVKSYPASPVALVVVDVVVCLTKTPPRVFSNKGAVDDDEFVHPAPPLSRYGDRLFSEHWSSPSRGSSELSR